MKAAISRVSLTTRVCLELPAPQLKQGFSASATIDILSQVNLCWGVKGAVLGIVGCWAASLDSTQLYPLVVKTRNICRRWHMSPGEKNPPQLRIIRFKYYGSYLFKWRLVFKTLRGCNMKQKNSMPLPLSPEQDTHTPYVCTVLDGLQCGVAPVASSALTSPSRQWRKLGC